MKSKKGDKIVTSTGLKGCSFYLHLTNYKNRKQLETRLSNLGGKVENFLSRSVTYFITNHRNGNGNGCRKPVLYKPPESKVMTRAQKMLAEAYQRSPLPATTSILDKAENLGISVQSLEKTLKWLDELELYFTPGQKHRKCTSLSSSKALKSPYIKIEDKSKLYQPICIELRQFPSLQFSQMYFSPFEKPNQITRRRVSETSSCLSSSKSVFSCTTKTLSKTKSGYCELCNKQYNHRRQHLLGEEHRSAITPELYSAVDKLIAGGKSFSVFVKELDDKNVRKNLTNRTAVSKAAFTERRTQTEKAIIFTSSNITIDADIPVKITLSASPMRGCAVKRVRSQTLSNTSLVESIDASKVETESSNKRQKLNGNSCVEANHLTINLRHISKSNSRCNSIEVKLSSFESPSKEVEKIYRSPVTRRTKCNLKKSDANVELRRSRRIMNMKTKNVQ